MVAKISVKPSLDKVKADFKARKEKLSDLFPAHKKVSIFLDSWVQRNFKAEGGGLGGDRWEPFKYGGRINMDGKGSPIQIQVPWGVLDANVDTTARLLQDTGRLRLSFLPFATERNAGIGSELEYSKNHDEGVGVPKRRILPNKSEVHDDIREILEKHGQKALKVNR